jgi:hypothetical protein
MRCPHCVVTFIVVLAAGVSVAAGAASASAHNSGWSRHKCNVVMVSWARAHLGKTTRAQVLAYKVHLEKTHGCVF